MISPPSPVHSNVSNVLFRGMEQLHQEDFPLSCYEAEEQHLPRGKHSDVPPGTGKARREPTYLRGSELGGACLCETGAAAHTLNGKGQS